MKALPTLPLLQAGRPLWLTAGSPAPTEAFLVLPNTPGAALLRKGRQVEAETHVIFQYLKGDAAYE